MGRIFRASLLAGALAGAACSTMPPEPAPPAPAAPEPAADFHDDWADAILYFVILDRFADDDSSNNVQVDSSQPGHFHGGDLRGLIDHIDEIDSLGVTALWVTPMVKNIDGFVSGVGFPDYAYHGYWADDFYRVDPRFGTEAELAELVEACHARGIRVLLDVVYNHSGYDSHYIEDPETQRWMRAYGECGDDDLTMCVGGLPDFRTELPEVADYLLRAHLGLAERTGVDGFRLDTVKHVGHDFWQEHRRRTRAELGENFFLLGEVWGGDPDVLDPWFEGDEIDAGFDFGFPGSVLGWVEGRGRTIAFNRYLERRHRTRDGYHLAHYLSSHDVPTAPFQLGGDWTAYRLAVTLQMTTVGIPVLYYGEEVGRLGGEWPDNRSDFPWGNRDIAPGAGAARDEELRADVARLIAVRRAHHALSRGNYQGLSHDGDVLVFRRVDAASEDEVIVALNRGAQDEAVTILLPESWSRAQVYDALSDSEIERDRGGLTLPLGPRSARVLVPR